MSTRFDELISNKDSMREDSIARQTRPSILNVEPVSTRDRDIRRSRRSRRRTMSQDIEQPNMRNRIRGTRKGSFLMWIIAIAALAFAILIISFILVQKATITIIPKVESITIAPNIVFTAYKKTKPGELKYTVLSKTIESSRSIETTGSEKVNKKASGKIRIYNNYSAESLRLIKNTRFETSSGYIYRIRNSVVVPGKKNDGTKGSLDVLVYADRAGKSQNIPSVGTKFTIPGLKGGPRFSGFYATSVSPIVGGFIGTRAVVDPTSLASTRISMRKELTEKAFKSIQSSNKTKKILFKDSLFTTFESFPIEYTKTDTATVREKLNITAPVFNEGELAKVLSNSASATPNDGNLAIDSPENLSLVILNKSTVLLSSDTLIQFTLEGKTTLTSKINTEGLKKDLAGKPRNMINTIMSAYPGIRDGKATVRPFWKKTFPSKINRIQIKINPTK